jgi:hypothetical protein
MGTPWDDRNQDYTHADAKEVLENTNPLGALWGAVSGGNKDPIQQWMDQQYGGMTGNEGGYNTIRWQPGDEDVYNQMDKAQWDALGNQRITNQRGWIERRKQELTAGAKPGQFWDPKTGKSVESVDPVDQRIMEFYRRMMAPLDPNDPEVKAITGNAMGISNREAANRGIQGGMSVAGATNAALNAQGALASQRQDRGLNVLGMMSGRDLQLKGMANQNAKDIYGSQMAQRQAAGGMLGGLIGGTGVMGLNAQSGAALGSGLGGLSAGTYRPPALSGTGMTRGIY